MSKQILEQILENYPKEKDKKLILEAFEFARAAHEGQKRFSGEDYIVHPLRTALILSHLKLDAKTIAAAFLHDVIDDTKVSPLELEKKFGDIETAIYADQSLIGDLVALLAEKNGDVRSGVLNLLSRIGTPYELVNYARGGLSLAQQVRGWFGAAAADP